MATKAATKVATKVATRVTTVDKLLLCRNWLSMHSILDNYVKTKQKLQTSGAVIRVLIGISRGGVSLLHSSFLSKEAASATRR